jgi:hypothetical protein
MMRDKLLVMLLTRICWEPNIRQRSRDSIHGQLLSFPPSLPLLAGVLSNAAPVLVPYRHEAYLQEAAVLRG